MNTLSTVLVIGVTAAFTIITVFGVKVKQFYDAYAAASRQHRQMPRRMVDHAFDCAVCFDELHHGQGIHTFDCGHRIHRRCLPNTRGCPYCD